MLFVKVMHYINKGIYLCNAILVTELFCYRSLTIDNYVEK